MIELYINSIIIDNKEIIEEGNIVANDGDVITIKGNSGCGKTVLLYSLGLMSSYMKGVYCIDKKEIDLSNIGECDYYRQRKFAFLFQDNAMVENLNIKENIRYIARMSGNLITEEEIIEIIKKVGLSESLLKAYPRELSGGEQQRAALACALSKHANYYFVDEPTASLDADSAQLVISLLKEEACKGKTVIIASHDPSITEISDKVYCIKDKKIFCIRDKVNENILLTKKENESEQVNQGISLIDIVRMSKKQKMKGRHLRRLVVCFCAIAICGMVLVGIVLSYLKDSQEKLIQQISDREIFVVNKVDSERQILYRDGNIPISSDEAKAIESFYEVRALYPYFEFHSFNLGVDEFGIDSSINVNKEDCSYDVSFSLESDNLEEMYFSVAPYVPEMEIEKQVEIGFDSHASCYISNQLADILNIGEKDKGKQINISFDVYVPVGLYKDVEYTGNAEGTEMYFDYSKKISLSVSVAGILNSDYYNHYTSYGDNMIYFDITDMQEYQRELEKKYYNNVDTIGIEIMPWSMNSMLVYADKYNQIPLVRSKIENINGTLITRCDYNDSDRYDEIINIVSIVSNYIEALVLGIIFFLMFVVFISYTLSKRKDYAILMANGFGRKNLILTTLIDGLGYSFKIILICITVCFGVYVFGRFLLIGEMIRIPAYIGLMIILMSIGFVAIPTLICILITVRIKPDRILRY